MESKRTERCLVLSAAAIAALLGGCALWHDIVPPAPHGAARIEKMGLALEYSPWIDRVTFFGPAAGENVLHVVDVGRSVPEDGSCTFFGGCYSWVAPQKHVPAGEGVLAGWIDAEGAAKDWPPDPVMDIGPDRRTGAGPDWLTSIGPEQRTGLVEEKALRLIDRDRATLTCTLKNHGKRTLAAGIWLTTAVGPGSVIAVRMPEGTQVYGWNDRSVTEFRSLLSAPDARGWTTISTEKASWEGGIKVYLAAAAGAPVDVAIWSAGSEHWFFRSQPVLTDDSLSRLIAMGEGPVALYMEPKAEIFEAELYGPIETLGPGAETSVTEIWRLFPAESPDTSLLP